MFYSKRMKALNEEASWDPVCHTRHMTRRRVILWTHTHHITKSDKLGFNVFISITEDIQSYISYTRLSSDCSSHIVEGQLWTSDMVKISLYLIAKLKETAKKLEDFGTFLCPTTKSRVNVWGSSLLGLTYFHPNIMSTCIQRVLCFQFLQNTF